MQAAFTALEQTGLAPTLHEIFELESLRTATRDDLVVAIPTNDQHLPLVHSSRHWRQVRPAGAAPSPLLPQGR